MVLAVVFALVSGFYFCRCVKWGHDTNNIFKDVGKEIELPYKEAIPAKGIIEVNDKNDSSTMAQSDSTTSPASGSPLDWTEMNDMASPNSGKHRNYDRSASKDSMEILLDQKSKVVSSVTERGTSESTSGCESGQKYESDELDQDGETQASSSKSASQSPASYSSENISNEKIEWIQQARQDIILQDIQQAANSAKNGKNNKRTFSSFDLSNASGARP